LFHIAFNVATAALFIGLLDGMARLLKTLLPERVKEADASGPRYLDESALETPSLALADAARETLHMGDHVEIMLRKVMAAMMTNDRALVDQVSLMDNSVDSLDEAIKLYVTKLTRGSLDVLRDLRRIHSHICSVAYPVLDAAGELAAYRSTESDVVALPAPAPSRS